MSKKYLINKIKPRATNSLVDLRTFFLRIFHQEIENGCLTKLDLYVHHGMGRSSEIITSSRVFASKLEAYLGLKHCLPLEQYIQSFDEVTVLSLIEFIHDFIESQTKDSASARKLFRDDINAFLQHYEKPCELNQNGEIEFIGLEELSNVVDEVSKITFGDDEIDNKINSSIRKFKDSIKDPECLKDAIRDLADVFEKLRSSFKDLMPDEEQFIFNLANNYQVRHLREGQKKSLNNRNLAEHVYYFFLLCLHTFYKLRQSLNN